MTVCISILRGINVSGKNIIRMQDLKNWYIESGFEKVTTYIQSGNVVFYEPRSRPVSEIANHIRTIIEEKTGFKVPVIVRTLDEMLVTVRDNPFMTIPGINQEKLHVTFLSENPESLNSEKLLTCSFPPDQFVVQNRDIYLYIPESYGNTKLSNAFFESRLKVTATTRNWATVKKLLEMGEQPAGRP